MDINLLVKAILEWLTDKKAENIIVYHVAKISGYTDYVIVCEASADLHVRAIANYILDNVKDYGISVLGKEGIEFAHWALIDLGEVIVHIFLPQTRQYYKIDELLYKLSQPVKDLETSSNEKVYDTETVTI